MENKLIIFKSHEERAKERVSNLIGEVEGRFFSGVTPLAYNEDCDEYFLYSRVDVEKIQRRLSQPNLFGIEFDVSLVETIGPSGFSYYHLRVNGNKRAA